MIKDVQKKQEEKIALYEKQIFDLEQMLEISRSLCSQLDLSSLIEAILYIVMAQLHVMGAGIYTMEEFDSSDFTLRNNVNGLEVNAALDYRIACDSKIITKLTAKNSACTLAELDLDVDSKETASIKSLNPSLIVPLILKNRINGIMVLGERIVIDDSMGELYTDYEIKELMTIASLSAVAINNAILIEQSSTDIMTHLRLKYYFFNVLTDKLDEAFAKGKLISVLMFDIDFFKHFNDLYGHACGDYVLQSVARIIRESIREGDIASRYGGEEFTVMLNNTGKTEAMIIAERIRKNIEDTDFVYNSKHMKVTISGGVSLFSVEDNPVLSAVVLVNQADQALYLSKSNGRNRITFADPKTIEKSFKDFEKKKNKK